jgi:putative FmdB family regulatory protein
MPTYEYICKRCGENIEVFQSFSEKPLRKHQQCDGELQKVFHARGVVFKGSGFYSTDSRSSAPSKKSEPAKKADSSKKSETATTGSTTSSSGTSAKSD